MHLPTSARLPPVLPAVRAPTDRAPANHPHVDRVPEDEDEEDDDDGDFVMSEAEDAGSSDGAPEGDGRVDGVADRVAADHVAADHVAAVDDSMGSPDDEMDEMDKMDEMDDEVDVQSNVGPVRFVLQPMPASDRAWAAFFNTRQNKDLWQHMEVHMMQGEKMTHARCKECVRTKSDPAEWTIFPTAGNNGTSNLWRHINKNEIVAQ
ncbi:hypothetical protein GGF32_003690 [Allomyces javanicus]|nr:hypothetical protein GGF32_003690 [Allomyces javanicus]